MKRFIRFSLVILLISTVIFLSACRDESDNTAEREQSTEYELSLTVREGLGEVVLSEKVKINDAPEGVEELVFRIYPEAYREDAETSAYFDDMKNKNLRYGGIDVSNVKVNGVDVRYLKEGTILTVPLSAPVGAGESIEVKIGARIIIPSGSLRFGGDGRVARLLNFYPVLARYADGEWDVSAYSRIGDPFSSDTADYRVSVYAPKSVAIATSGELISDEEEGVSHAVYSELKGGRDFAVVLYEGYNCESREADGVKFNYFYREGSGASLDVLVEAAEYFTKLFGSFPYTSLSVAESPFYYGGMEYSGLVVVNENALDKEDIIVHELLHQWIGCAVGSDGVREPWVDESLVSFLGAYYYRIKGDEEGYRAARAMQDKQFETFYRGEKLNSAGYVPRIERSVYEFRSLYEYDSVVYKRGAAMYSGIVELCGDKKFCRALREYYEKFSGGNATGEELISSFERSLGNKVYPIFVSYLESDVKSGSAVYLPAYV